MKLESHTHASCQIPTHAKACLRLCTKCSASCCLNLVLPFGRRRLPKPTGVWLACTCLTKACQDYAYRLHGKPRDEITLIGYTGSLETSRLTTKPCTDSYWQRSHFKHGNNMTTKTILGVTSSRFGRHQKHVCSASPPLCSLALVTLVTIV